MENAKDGLGRSTGRRFNMAAVKRELERRDGLKATKSATLYQQHLADARKPGAPLFAIQK